MADLGTELKDYLSKSTKTSIAPGQENGKSYFNFLGKGSEPTAVDDTTSGWFTQAQKDPLLPGLVSCWQYGMTYEHVMLVKCIRLAKFILPFIKYEQKYRYTVHACLLCYKHLKVYKKIHAQA